jgi:arylsulfatase A-like enzyme
LERPNVLVIMQDQLRYDLVANAAPCRTPAFDRLRAEGTWFTRAYTPAGICGPARAAFLTGLYPHSNGVLNNVSGTDAVSRNLRHDVPTMGELLAKAGYRTGYVGKWHVGVEDQASARGFSDVHVSDPEMWAEYKDWAWRFAVENPDAVLTRYPPPSERLAERFPRVPFPMYATSPVDDEAILPARGVLDHSVALLERYAAGDEPFFLMTSFQEPHWPYVLPEPFASMYDPADIPPWPNFDDPFIDKPFTNQSGLEHFGVGGFTWEDWQPAVARYLGSVSLLDDIVGRLLQAVDRLGLADNTVVVATADHGDMAGSHRQFNKGPFMYEEVYRLPFVWRGPGIAAGQECDALTGHLDVLPTLLELADAPAPGPLHGRSLTPVAADPAHAEGNGWRDALMSEFHGDEFGLYSQRMVRWEHYKLVYNPNDRRELYDLAADPHELHNLAYRPEHADLRRDLEGRLLELMHESDDSLRLWAVNVLG